MKLRAKILIAAAAAVLSAAGLLWFGGEDADAAPPAPPPVPVSVALVEQRDVPATLRAVGNVRSQRNVEIRPQVDGVLVELPVREGMQVRRGDLIARIDDRAVSANLQQARGQLAATTAQLFAARTDLTRYQTLARDQTISRQMFDQQAALVSELQATVRTRDAAVAAGQVELSYTRVHSPVDGRIGIRNVDVGNVVRAGDVQTLFSVVQIDPISVEFALPQGRLPQVQALLREGRRIPVRAYSNDGGTLLAEGELGLIDNRVSSQTGSIRLKADFANGDDRLWPDQSVVVVLETGVINDALVVPQRAIQHGADSARVWRIRNGKAEPAPVQVDYDDGRIAVVRGLAAGDSIVIDGQSRLRPGAAVQRIPTAAGPVRVAASAPGASLPRSAP